MKRPILHLGSLLVFGMVMGTGTLSALEIKTNANAVNTMGKLRMLSWRLLKDHVEIGMGIPYRNPQNDIKKTFSNYQENLQALKSYVKDPLVKEKLQALEKKLESCRALVKGKPQLADATKCYHETIALKKLAQDGVDLLSKQGHTAVAKAGRLRAVSQSLSAIYMLKTWGMKDADQAIAKPMKRFRSTLDYLKAEPITGPEAKKIINKLEKTYLFFQVMDSASGTFTPTLVEKKTRQMLKDAQALTMTYVQQQ
jgi:nitrate/nitrite-specific signal transduction histidine kinase